MTSVNWLHLTDLHRGMQEQDLFLPGVMEVLFDDLRSLHKECGPWHIVFFTGDLVNRGKKEEYQHFDEFKKQLWNHLQELGSNPILLTVPGNHDLLRPDRSKSPEVTLLSEWSDRQEVQNDFWNKPSSPYRRIVDKAFGQYSRWWDQHLPAGGIFKKGMLPGDFSFSFEKGGVRIGIIGLNTSFLQLQEGDYQGRLALSVRQFHEACGGNGIEWSKKHQVCLFLTHHPPAWLDVESQRHLYGEIVAHGRFAVHLCGHMHETSFTQISEGGSDSRQLWQGRSLFGLEHFVGTEEREDRSHGYVVGSIDFSGPSPSLRFWPRVALRQPYEWRIVPDHAVKLDKGDHTSPISVKMLHEHSGAFPDNVNTSSSYDDKKVFRWPDSRPDADTRIMIHIRSGLIHAQIETMIRALQQGRLLRHPIVGKFLVGANNLRELAIPQLRTLLEENRSEEECWNMLFVVEKELVALSEEYIDFRAGAELCKEEAGRLCNWADHLLKEIGAMTGDGWQGTCVVANRSVAGSISHLVRLAFLDESLWGLPFAAFQFVSLMKDATKVGLLGVFTEPDNVVDQLIVSDMLTTHFMGPAYAFATVALWVRSQSVTYLERDGRSSSSSIRSLRFHSLIQTLSKYGELYAQEIDWLRELWKLRPIGGEYDAADLGRSEVSSVSIVDRLYARFIEGKYGAIVNHVARKRNAQKIVQWYHQGISVTKEMLTELDITELVGAAWYSRMLLADPTELPKIQKYYATLLEARCV